MTDAKILKGAVVKNAVIAPGAVVKDGQRVVGKPGDIKLFAEKE